MNKLIKIDWISGLFCKMCLLIQCRAGLVHVYEKYVNPDFTLNEWFIGIFSVNRYEWVVADLGAGCYGIPNVSLYDTLGPETSEYIINHSELSIILCSLDKVATLLDIAKKCPTLKVIIAMDSPYHGLQESPLPILQKWASQLGITLLSFPSILALGKKNPRPHRPPKPDDTYIISYTSGTTGNPKGAVILHKNMISALRGANIALPVTNTDVHVCYLPLAHIFERVLLSNQLLNGGGSGFFRGDVSLLIEDLSVLKPTIFASVPRLFNRIYDKIIQGALGGSKIKAALFQKALDAKLYHLDNGGHLVHSVWDPLVFNKVKVLFNLFLIL